jgi:hypothetical protein
LREEINLEYIFYLRHRRKKRQTAMRRTGIIDQHVDAAELSHREAHQLLALPRIGDVGLVGAHSGTGLLDECGGLGHPFHPART